MWKHRYGILTPLLSMTSGQAKWNWREERQKAFDTIKDLVSQETLLFYPNFNKPFIIHRDTRELQLGVAKMINLLPYI